MDSRLIDLSCCDRYHLSLPTTVEEKFDQWLKSHSSDLLPQCRIAVSITDIPEKGEIEFSQLLLLLLLVYLIAYI